MNAYVHRLLFSTSTYLKQRNTHELITKERSISFITGANSQEYNKDA